MNIKKNILYNMKTINITTPLFFTSKINKHITILEVIHYEQNNKKNI